MQTTNPFGFCCMHGGKLKKREIDKSVLEFKTVTLEVKA